MTTLRLAAALLMLLCCHGGTLAQTVILYSRADAEPAQRLQRVVALYDQVFMDADMLPGVAWRQEIAARIRASRRVLVLWSARAATSMELGAEWRLALAFGVPVVPVLLDDTPLPATLDEVQGIDWR